MNKRVYIFVAIFLVLLVVGFLGFYLIRSFIYGPIYIPGDLTGEAHYEHLLSETKKADRPDFFEVGNDISLYYFTKGEGKPVLIVHGGPGIPYEESWKGLAGLESKYKFYYYHQRGSGKSTRPFDRFEDTNFFASMQALNKDLGLPAQIADIEQIRRKLKQEKITLIGHSFGGFIATLYAVEFPERVESLILIAPADVLKLPADSGGLYEIVEKRLPAENLTEYKKYIDRVMDFGSLFEKSEKELAEQNREFIKYWALATGKEIEDVGKANIGGWVQYACFISMGVEHDYSKHLDKITAPTLIIHGGRDLLPVESVKLYRENISGSSFRLIEDASHFPYDEKPDEFERIVSEFLEKN